MRVLFRDNLPLAEYVLRIITGKDDLHLTKEDKVEITTGEKFVEERMKQSLRDV